MALAGLPTPDLPPGEEPPAPPNSATPQELGAHPGLARLLRSLGGLLGPEGLSPALQKELRQAEGSLCRARGRWLRLELLRRLLGELIRDPRGLEPQVLGALEQELTWAQVRREPPGMGPRPPRPQLLPRLLPELQRRLREKGQELRDFLLGAPQNPPKPPQKPPNPPKNPQNPPKNPQNPPKNPQNPPKNPQNPPKNPPDPASKNPQNPPKMPQNLPQTPQNLPKTTQNLPQNPQNPPKNPQNLPKIPQNLPKNPQNLPQNPLKNPPNPLSKISQDLPKTPQDLPQNPPNLPQNPQNPPKNPQNPPKTPQNPPKTPQNPPKNAQNPLKNPQNPSSKNPQNPPKTPQDLPQNPPNFPQNPPNFPPNPQNLPQNPQNPQNAPNLPQNAPNLGGILRAERRRLQRERLRERRLREQLERLSWKYPQVLSRCLSHLRRGRRQGALQADLDGGRGRYLLAKGGAVLLKSRLEELRILLDTYPAPTIEAHRRIRAGLLEKRRAAEAEAAILGAELASLRGLGPEFRELALELGRIRQESAQKRWALRQLRPSP